MNAKEQEAFVAHLRENPCDQAVRLIYSDWLLDYGMDEESQEQRRRASDEWCSAYQELDALAKQCGSTKEWTDIGWNGDYERASVANWRELTVNDLIDAGTMMANSGGSVYFVQGGSEDAQSLFRHQDVKQRFWESWAIVTGRNDAQFGMNPFRCSC